MQRLSTLTALLVGVIAAASFLLSLYFTNSMLLPFAPFLVLGLAGFAYGFTAAALIMTYGAAMVLLFAAGEATLAFVFLFGIPSLIFLCFTVYRDRYAVGMAMSWLTLYAALMVIAFAFAVAAREGGLESVVMSYLKQIAAMFEPQMAPEIEARFGAYPYVFLAIPVTYLVLACYGIMWLARYLMVLADQKPRPDLGVQPFAPPLWLPLLLIVVAFFSFSGPAEAVFTSKALFLILLLPYFLSGLSLLHHASRNWASRFWMLLMLYIGISITPWIPAAIAVLGGVDHARSFLRKQE